MLNNIFLKSLRDQRRSMVWWELGIIVVSIITCATYPSFKDNTQLDDVLGDSEFLKALSGGFESLSSGEGFVNTQLLAAFMPVLVMIFVIRLGTNTIAGEERDATIDVLLANPVSRVSALAQKFGALLVSTLALTGAVWVSLLVGSALFGMGLDLWRVTQACVSLTLFGWAFGALALAVGSATGKTGMTFAVTSAIGAAAYLLHTFTPLVDALEPLKYLSMFYYYIAVDPLTNGISVAHALVMAAVTAVLFGAAAYTFDRRDLAI